MTQMPPPAQPSGPQFFEPQQAPRGVSGLAVAALVLGICGIIPLLGIPLGLVGIILGIVALTQNVGGKGLALAGVIVGACGVVFVNTLILAILMPALGGARELAKQAACQANLNMIGKACKLYSAMSQDLYPYPMIAAMGNPNAPLDSGTKDSPFQCSPNGMNNVWLLIQQNLLSPNAFKCPSDSGWVQRDPNLATYGWTSLKQFSYGIQYPYDPNKVGYGLGNPNLDGGVVVFADRNPGGSVGPSRKPSNHPKDGEAYLMNNGSAGFYKSTHDSAAGFSSTPTKQGDDIYVSGDGKAGGMPTDPNDTSITPVPSR